MPRNTHSQGGVSPLTDLASLLQMVTAMQGPGLEQEKLDQQRSLEEQRLGQQASLAEQARVQQGQQFQQTMQEHLAKLGEGDKNRELEGKYRDNVAFVDLVKALNDTQTAPETRAGILKHPLMKDVAGAHAETAAKDRARAKVALTQTYQAGKKTPADLADLTKGASAYPGLIDEIVGRPMEGPTVPATLATPPGYNPNLHTALLNLPGKVSNLGGTIYDQTVGRVGNIGRSALNMAPGVPTPQVPTFKNDEDAANFMMQINSYIGAASPASRGPTPEYDLPTMLRGSGYEGSPVDLTIRKQLAPFLHNLLN